MHYERPELRQEETVYLMFLADLHLIGAGFVDMSHLIDMYADSFVEKPEKLTDSFSSSQSSFAHQTAS